MIDISLNNIKKYYGARQILENVTFEVHSSEKVGIVGENGCGKSTLLKIIMGLESCEAGTISIRKGAKIGYLEQIPVYPEEFKVIDILNKAFEKVDNVYKELSDCEQKISSSDGKNMEKLFNRYSRLQEDYEKMGGYDKEEKLSKVCTGLKIDDVFKEKMFSKLSGGEKTTVILGKMLLQNPDILLLDEPSNHLDLDSVEWLESYLKSYKGSVIIVSHDRYFLDNVVTKIVEIEDMVSQSYNGNYTAYVNEKDRQLELKMHDFINQEKKVKSMESSIAQLIDWGNRGGNNKFFRRAFSMQKMLDKMEKIKKPKMERESISINANMAGRSGNEVIIVKDLCKKLGNRVLFKNASLLIRNGERTALIGHNGCGKTTLLNILLNKMKADSGEAYLGSSVKAGYLPQIVSFDDEDRTVLECFRQSASITEGKAREYLARYMFFDKSVFKKVKSLSGGEKSRLKLAILMYNEINLLILDEPTNHLDINSREELEIFLKKFKGTLFFVSHDRYFINNIADRVIELSNGVLNSYEGNYEYYKEKAMFK